MKQDIQKCIDTLHKGGIILYPTDTIWGLGCDATNPDAVEKLYSIKHRPPQKSMLILIENMNQVTSYVDNPPEVALDMMELSTEPLTIVFDKAKNLPHNLIAEDGSIAIRLVKSGFVAQLLSRFKRPVVSTSANFSGSETPLNFSDISDQLLAKVDYASDTGREKRHKKTSSVIKIKGDGEIIILRK